jgi:proteasome lid subunit RPN8/RPN11
MDVDIQFGELEEAAPQARLRPDRNRHYAVVAYGSPRERDLPIFVDVDVMRDMEAHALSNTSVELGGVMLGGQFEDQGGRPFVLVTDSLRAEHYESTKGSFKFTHDTWAKISRQRDEFPADLQMVGWYHTHPDWGVFLSGMDLFICENFFNKPLDVALVIDPCRGERGMFQRADEPAKRVRRTGGFFLMASRFRQQELELYAAQLEGRLIMTTDPRFGPFPAPVVNVGEPRSPWQGLAALGMLTAQFVLLALIAWRLLSADHPPARVAALEGYMQQQVEAERIEAEKELLDRVFQDLKGEPEGTVPSLMELKKQNDDLLGDLRAQRVLVSNRDGEITRLERKLLAADNTQMRLQQALASLEAENDRLDDENRTLQAEVKELEQAQAKEGDGGRRFGWPWIAATAAAAAAALGVAAVVFLWRKEAGEEDDQPADEEDGKANY